MVREGQVLDEMRITLTLDNRQSLPVSLSPVDLIHIVNVRSNGAEMPTGYVQLPGTYELMPGKFDHRHGGAGYSNDLPRIRPEGRKPGRLPQCSLIPLRRRNWQPLP